MMLADDRKSEQTGEPKTMPSRSAEFSARALAKLESEDQKRNPEPPRMCPEQDAFDDAHNTTAARVNQARYLFDELRAHLRCPSSARREYGPGVNGFVVRDMLTFGLANSLRSALDTFAHEIAAYYRGHVAKPERLQFYTLFNSGVVIYADPMPTGLERHIKRWQEKYQDGRPGVLTSPAYLNAFRNATQHRSLVRTYEETEGLILAAGDFSDVDDNDDAVATRAQAVRVQPAPAPWEPPDPIFQIPDDPSQPVTRQTYAHGRDLLSTFHSLHLDVKEFLRAAYDLAR